MGRVINTNSPIKRRNYEMRTIAEILRLLSQKREVDDEVRDMVATIVYSLRTIDDTVTESITAWEKRGYWKKADDFQQKWWWVQQMAPRIEKLVRSESWGDLPEILVKLLPHVSDIEVTKLTRKSETWSDQYIRLMDEKD